MILQRCLSWLSLVCVCLFALFSSSLTVYASDDLFQGFPEDNPVMNLSESMYSDDMICNYYMATTDLNYFAYSTNTKDFASDWEYKNIYLITSLQLPQVMDTGQTFDISWRTRVNGCSYLDYYVVLLYDTNWGFIGSYNPGNNNGSVTYENGEYRYYISGLSGDRGIKYIRLAHKVSLNVPCSVNFTSSNYEVYKVSDSGKLNSIIAYIKNIFTSITNLPQNIANSIKGFFDNVVNSVTNIGNLIKSAIVDLGNTLLEGIKSLFIPSADDIVEMKFNWDSLMSDRFGALYDAIFLVFEYFSLLTESGFSSSDTISFPVVEINLCGVPFSFGGYDVKIVPDGFDFFVDVLKVFINLIATIAFINAMKSRYDNVMR